MATADDIAKDLRQLERTIPGTQDHKDALGRLAATVSATPDGKKLLKMALEPTPEPRSPQPSTITPVLPEALTEPLRPMRKPKVSGSLGGDDSHTFKAVPLDLWDRIYRGEA